MAFFFPRAGNRPDGMRDALGRWDFRSDLVGLSPSTADFNVKTHSDSRRDGSPILA